MNIGGEQIVKSVTPFKNICIPAGLLKDFADMDHARKDFEIMPHLVLPEIDLFKNSKYVEYLQFVHDKFLLHELKKSHPQFAQLIHVNILTYQDYSKFKYDREFVQEFSEFIQAHIKKSSNIYLSAYIPSANMNNNIK